MDTAVDPPPTSLQGSAPQPEVGIAIGEEYRRDERYPVNGDAEVVVLGGTSLFRGRIMDISISGCYIQTLAWVRLKPETPVEILFAVDGKVVRALAASRYVKSKVGIGFRFLKMNEEMQRKLDELIDDARTRFMELTRQTKGLHPGSGNPPVAKVPLPVDPAALQVVAVREQERAGSAPGAKLPSNPMPPVPAALTQPSPSFSPIVEEAAVAVASLEAEAAGVQTSQLLEVSELSKADQPADESLDDASATLTEDASAAPGYELHANPTPSAAQAFEVDEDASDVGHAEIWNASSGLAHLQSVATTTPSSNSETEIAPADFLSADAENITDPESTSEAGISTEPELASAPDSHVEPESTDTADVLPEPQLHEDHDDSTPYAHIADTCADPPADLQQFEELIHRQPGSLDERAQGADSQFSVLGD